MIFPSQRVKEAQRIKNEPRAYADLQVRVEHGRHVNPGTGGVASDRTNDSQLCVAEQITSSLSLRFLSINETNNSPYFIKFLGGLSESSCRAVFSQTSQMTRAVCVCMFNTISQTHSLKMIIQWVWAKNQELYL